MMKTILQHDESDCGAACLAMIASHYRYYNNLSFFKEITKTDCDGINIYGLVDGAGSIGLHADAFNGEFDELVSELSDGNITFPFVAHIINQEEFLHFIVIEKIQNGRVYFRDPGKGKAFINIDDFCEIWTGYIVAFSKTESFEKGNYKKSPFLEVLKLLFLDYKKFIGLLVLSLIISFIGIAGSLVFELVIDNSVAKLSIVFLALLTAYLFSCLIQYIRGKMLISFQTKIDKELGNSYFEHILNMPVSAIEKLRTGEYLTRFSDMEMIRNAISTATITLLLDAVMVVVCGIVLFSMEKTLFLISLIFIIIYVFLVIFFKNPINSVTRKSMETNAVTESYIKECVDGIQTIKSCNAENTIKETFTRKFTNQITAIINAGKTNLLQDNLNFLVEIVYEILILWVGFSLVSNEILTLGTLISFFYLKVYFTEPVKNLVSLQPMLQNAIVAFDRLDDVLSKNSEDKLSGNELHDISNIEISGLDFRYGNRELTLENVNLSINKGDKVALVGESGCGKTTIAKLLVRYYDACGGMIKINGQNIQAYKIDDIRNKIIYVSQESFVFSGSILDTLKMGNPDATREEIEKVCSICEIHEFIQSLPQGYNSFLYENGANLSGGQKQRLSIARALLRHPSVLILDEATSNLDTSTENAIRNAICSFDDMICIIIAHKLSMVQQCDKIFVLSDKTISESGSHEELIRLNGKYAELLDLQ